MYMKDSVSAAEVGTGQYATTKGISQTNLITTVTPEKKTEEDKDDEEGKKKRAEEVTPISAIRHDTKVEFSGFCIKQGCLESALRNTEFLGKGEKEEIKLVLWKEIYYVYLHVLNQCFCSPFSLHIMLFKLVPALDFFLKYV